MDYTIDMFTTTDRNITVWCEQYQNYDTGTNDLIHEEIVVCDKETCEQIIF